MQFKNAFQSSSKTFFNQVIKYGSFCCVPATHYGKDMKLIARESFTEYISEHHEHVLVKETGLHAHPNYPYIRACPDGILCCSCHRESLLEIKCPCKYREKLKGCVKDFPISVTGEIKKIKIILSNETLDVCKQQKADIFLYLVKTPKTEK